MRKIDVFTHIFPAAYQAGVARVAPNVKDIGKRMRGIPMLVDLDERFRVMDRFEGYQQVLSIATPPIELFARPADAIDLAKAANDGMAELVDLNNEASRVPLRAEDALEHLGKAG